MIPVLALVSLVAFAEAPEFEEFAEYEAPAEDVEEEDTGAEILLSAELGGALTTGNSDFFTLSSTLNGSWKLASNKATLVAGAMTGQSRIDADGDGILEDAEREEPRVKTAERYFADARYDRFFGPKNSIYLLGGVFTDEFAGYTLRSHEQVGYSRSLLTNDTSSVLVEIGVDIAQEKFVAGVDPGYQDVVAGRLMLGLSHTFNDAVSLSDTFEVYENVLDFEDLRMLNTAALTSQLSGKLSLKLGHELRFDNQPVDGFRPLDQTTTLTIVATFL